MICCNSSLDVQPIFQNPYESFSARQDCGQCFGLIRLMSGYLQDAQGKRKNGSTRC